MTTPEWISRREELVTHIGHERELLRHMISIHYSGVDRLFRLYVLLVSVPALALSLEVRTGTVGVHVPDVFGLDQNTLVLVAGVLAFCILIYRMVVEHHLKRLLYIRALNALRAAGSEAAVAASGRDRYFVLPKDPRVPSLFRLGADYFYEAGTVALANGMLFSVLGFNLLNLNGHFDIRRAGLGRGLLVFSFATVLVALLHLVAHSRAARKVEGTYWDEPRGIDAGKLWELTGLRRRYWRSTWTAFQGWLLSERYGSWAAALASAVVFSVSTEIAAFVWTVATGSAPHEGWRFWHELARYWPFSTSSALARAGLSVAAFFAGAHIVCSLHWRRQRERLFLLSSLGYLAAYAAFLFPLAELGHEMERLFLTSGFPAVSFVLAGYTVALVRGFTVKRHYSRGSKARPESAPVV